MYKFWSQLFINNISFIESKSQQTLMRSLSFGTFRKTNFKREKHEDRDEAGSGHAFDSAADDEALFPQEEHYPKKSKIKLDKKYKRETTPNLLTWEEKEKIRSLFEENPQHWTLERLSGNFPATVPTIRKLLKNKWQPNDVKMHDEAVIKHWKQLMSGQFQISPELKAHLLSFAPKPVKNSEATAKEDEKKILLEEAQPQCITPTPFEDVDSKIETKQATDVGVWSNTGPITKYQTKRIAVEQQKPLYPEKIRIPKDKWINGATYKIGDVYYHSDGTFLYRVPGMY